MKEAVDGDLFANQGHPETSLAQPDQMIEGQRGMLAYELATAWSQIRMAELIADE